MASLLGISVAYTHLLIYFEKGGTEGTIYPLGSNLRSYKEIGSGGGMLSLANPGGEKPTGDAAEDTAPFTIKPARKIQPALIDELTSALQRGPVAAEVKVGEDPLPSWVKHVKWNIAGGNTYKISEYGEQTISIYVTCEVEIFGASDTDNDKYVRISTRGTGSTPGTLFRDERTDRGYFQDRVSIVISTEADQAFTLFDHGPDNVNDAETVSSDTTVGLSKDGVEASVSKSIEMTVTDFNVVNVSVPFRAGWDFKLNKIETQLKDRSFDGNIENIFDIYPMWGASAVCSLPTLAKASLQPNCQSIWTASPSDQSIRSILCQAEQHVYRAWIETGWDIEWYWYEYYNFQNDEISIDFSKV